MMEQESQDKEKKEGRSGPAEDENDHYKRNEKEEVDKAVTDELEENGKALTEGGDANSKTLIANTKKDSLTETKRGDIHKQLITAERGETQDQKLKETETEKCQTIQKGDESNKVATAEEIALHSHAEPMEVEATETSTTDAST